jgi:hypothetical protein
MVDPVDTENRVSAKYGYCREADQDWTKKSLIFENALNARSNPFYPPCKHRKYHGDSLRTQVPVKKTIDALSRWCMVGISESVTSNPMFLHRSHFLQREAKRIYHERDLPCVQVINLVQFNRDHEK